MNTGTITELSHLLASRGELLVSPRSLARLLPALLGDPVYIALAEGWPHGKALHLPGVTTPVVCWHEAGEQALACGRIISPSWETKTPGANVVLWLLEILDMETSE